MLSAFGFFLSARAQDRRSVAEPTIPPSPYCQVLTAGLPGPVSGVFEASVETTPPDTTRLNAALAQCSALSAASGFARTAVVQLSATGSNVAFLAGPINLQSGVTLLVDPGVTLYASHNAAEYDIAGKCGQLDVSSNGCTSFITANKVTNVALMGPGTIDGRGYAVVNVAGNTAGYTWWDLAQMALIQGLNQNNPRLIQLNSSTNITLYRINLRNSAKFHVATTKVQGFTAWGVSVVAPATSRNTDAFDPSGTDFTIADSYASVGDDNVAIKAGNGPGSFMTIARNHFYRGHGMSIGSETNAGADHILVTDLTLDGADNGLRIKSDSTRGGVVMVSYNDVCIRNVPDPLVFSAYYSPGTGSLFPNFASVELHNVHSLAPPPAPLPSPPSAAGNLVFQGYSAGLPLVIRLDNVIVDGIQPSQLYASDALITQGPGPVNFTPSGFDVAVYNTVGHSAPPVDCTNRFVPLVTAADMCDVDNNGRIDITDITAVLTARGTRVGRYDPRNPSLSGVVSVADARMCVARCTKAQCAQ